jgi:hypothetical protein
VGTCDLGGDVQPQAQPLRTGPIGAADEREKQSLDRLLRDRFPCVGDREHESVLVSSPDADRTVCLTVREGIG